MVKERAAIFFSREEVLEGGGGVLLEQTGEVKALQLELILVD